MSRTRTPSRVACFLLLVAALACSSPGTPTPTPTPTPTSSPRLQMSGRVLNENGSPVADAVVEVDYQSRGGASIPPSNCPGGGLFCWLATRTTATGEYWVEFEPVPWPNRGLGFVYSIANGHELDVQWVPVGTSPAVRNLRIRSSRSIVPGESTVVLVDANSPLCTDLEDLFALGNRCEIVLIDSGPGILTVEARAPSGVVVPTMYWYTTGNYAGFIERPGPGMVSIPVRGGTYRILVGLPEGAPSQQFNVTTSLR